MGKRLRNSITGPSLFFITFSTIDRENVFTDKQKMSLVESTVFEVMKYKKCSLHGYVIMPNHLHLLVGIKHGGKELSALVFSLKGMIRKRLVGNTNLWEERFDDLLITSEKQFKIKLEYIHNNPVKRGLAGTPESYRFSSYRFWTEDLNHEHLTKDLSKSFID